MINTDFLHSVQNGDEDAIQALIRANQRQVFQLALSILDTSKTDSAEAAKQAEIATRETFMTAIDRINRYREDSNFTTWLFGLAIQIARRRYRRWQAGRMLRRIWARLTRQPISGNAGSYDLAPQSVGKATVSAGTSMPNASVGTAIPGVTSSDAALWDAVRGLDERLRLPVILRYYHDFSIADIAVLLKISEGSVHARLDQARDKLAGK